MLVTGNLTGPHPIFHWKPCISGDLPHQSFESLVHPQRARSAGKGGLRNFSPLSPLSGPAETSNTVVLPFYHVFSKNITISKVVYTKFLDNGTRWLAEPPQAAVGDVGYEWILVFLPVVSIVILCTVHLSWEKAHKLLLLVIFPLRSHTFFCSNPVLSA